ncbi:MAG: hypothetical protein EGR45_05420 [Ruminococcaceae bacterium]|nr:hypothetical protein [Oscillospiraceae bacterium]
MENMTAARDISAVAPINVLRGIKPLCVPYVPSSDFAEETQHRADPRIESLWKRLGLVYLFDQPQPAAVSRTRVTVNNFTAQLVFRVCMQNHTDRLIERYQPGFVFPENIRRAAIEYTTGRSAAVRRVFDMIRENSRYTEEVSRIFRLVFEKESGGIPLQTVCRALAVLLGSTGGGAVLTSQQQVIFQRIASVLSEEYPESTAAQEIASVGAAAVFTETQRRRILDAASEMGYRSQHDAAQRVLSLVDSGRTREEIGKVLLSEISRYGLENAAPDDGQIPGRIIPAERESVRESAAVPGRVVQDIEQEYNVAEILYALSENTAEPGEVSSVSILENSVLRRISTAMKSAAIPGGRTESSSAPVAEFRGESTSRLVQTTEERSILAQLSRLSRVSRAEIFRSIFGNEQDIIGAPTAEKSLPGQANITAATAVRIISRLIKEQPGKSAIEPSPGGDIRDSGSVTRTIDILRRHSSEAGTQGSPAEINSGYYTVEQHLDLAVFPGSEQQVQGAVLPAESALVGDSTNVHITEIHSGEDGETVRESAAERVLPTESAPVGDSTNVHITEIHSGEDRETVRESAAGRVLPTESAPVGDSTNVHITEIHPGQDGETIRESAAGRVLPTESAPVGDSTNVHITEIHPGEDGETVRESAAGRVLPTESAPVGDSTNVHITEIHSGQDGEIVRESAAGMVLPTESALVGDSTNVHIAEIHPGEDGETVRESVAGTVLPAESRSESTVNTHILSEETQPVKSALGSYRSRLDRKTLEVIDRLVDSARSGTAPGITVQPGFPAPQGIELPQGSPAQSEIPVQLENPMPQELTYVEQSREIPPQTGGSDEVRNLSILRKSIVSLSSRHISRLIEKAGSTVAAERETPGKRLRYRNVDSADSMVMLIPPAEMDRFRAADPYARSMPPIELKEPSRPQESGNPGAVRSTIVNNKPVVVKSAESAVDSLSREDISRLADKVYDRIETRLSRERRRVGL